MSSRITRKRKRSGSLQHVDTPPPKWTKETLTTELQKCGITVPGSFGLPTLLKLYNENKDRSGQNTSLSNNENKDRSGQSTSLSNVNAQNEITSDVLQQPNLDIEASRINLNRQQRTSVSQPMLQVPNITIDNIVTSSNSSS